MPSLLSNARQKYENDEKPHSIAISEILLSVESNNRLHKDSRCNSMYCAMLIPVVFLNR